MLLLRLDVNPTSIHINPSSGEKIIGTHLHLYNEEYELGEAIPFDIGDKDLYDICYAFFERFHVITPPAITYQTILK